jgi:hypothetical protein
MAYLTTLPAEYYLFALTLAGTAVLHRHALVIALAGLGALLILITGNDTCPGASVQ